MSSSGLLQSLAKNVANIQERLLSQINKLKNKFPKDACPTREELLIVIAKRNALASGINQLQNQIKTLDRTGNLITKITTPIPPALSILKLIPLPTSLPGVTAGNIVILSDIFNTLKETLARFKSIAGGFDFLENFANSILNKVNDELKKLDVLIEKCAKELGIEYEVINDELNQDISEEGFGPYKGFTFEIKYDDLNQTPYPKRFAQALDKKKVVRLKSESSFASDPNVLIEELKFIIDTQNLKGD
jgi:hypothetical protein